MMETEQIKLNSMYRTALLTEKILKEQRNWSATNFKDFCPQRNFCNVSKQKN